MFKSICLTAVLALSALVVAGATPAAASVHVYTCMKKGEECKVASTGTTYETVSKEFVMKENEEVLDKCELYTTHKVVDPTSESAEDPMEVTTTAATFSNCSGSEGSLKAEGLPWSWKTNSAEYEKTQDVLLSAYSFKGFFCTWVLNAPGDLVRENLNTRVVTGNMLGQGSLACALLLISVNHTLAMNGVSDPNLSGAVDVVVK
jgi:hypothetical protein